MRSEIDRTVWKLPFRINFQRGWPCPTCGTGTLRVKADTFKHEEVRKSKIAFNHEYWDPSWTTYTFSCLLVCGNRECDEIVACTGDGSVEEDNFVDEDGESHFDVREYFRPKYFEPHLRLIEMPENCPPAVSALLDESFKLFFSSPSAASNSVRMAVEELLTELKVPRFISKKKRRSFISLHQRIGLLPQRYDQTKEFISAIKWLGNAGSHATGQINMDDVMDSYDMFALVLDEIYHPRKRRLQALARKVNKKRGPLKSKS
ncbi:MAG: DUF4145 domain-containing protein [Nitrospira sp.]|nr:DUF4145 domain-containing protein [Nitrospira sp.]HQY57656.1 DUF4145 domain-containing protein [Nitrospira sp.]HRA97002.1 DUF4145 domain-containing protein [Nitrospira sp.]